MHWGDEIQNDTIDAIRWAIAEGVADPNRICTYGGSFGGYSAVHLAIRAPDLIRCAVGVAGVYDLTRLQEEGGLSRGRWNRNIVSRYIGTDPIAMRAASPVHDIHRLGAPVLLLHGEDDERAPISHAKALNAAMEKAGKSVETLCFPGEGHGFRSNANRMKAFRRARSFVRQYTSLQTAAASATSKQ